MDHDLLSENERVSTGALPPDTDVQALITAGYELYLPLEEGAVADYIPALAAAPAPLAVRRERRRRARGRMLRGRAMPTTEFADPERLAGCSSSPWYVDAHRCMRRPAGSSASTATGLPFNSVMAIELNADRTMNPLVNAGAMATTSLVPGTTAEEKFEAIVATMSRFAGRRLVMDDEVYESGGGDQRPQPGIAHLLDGYGRHVPPIPIWPPTSTPGSVRCGSAHRHLAVRGANSGQRRGESGDR